MEPVDNDNDGLISMLDESKKGHQIAISLLGETGMNGYTRIKNHIDTALQLPSYYMVTKGRPKKVGQKRYCIGSNEGYRFRRE